MPGEPRSGTASLIPKGYGLRLLAMLGTLIIVGLTIYNMRGEALGWREHVPQAQAAADSPRKGEADWQETIVPGPADDDPIEQEEIKTLFDAVGDGQELKPWDMPAYWRLMRWARARSFAELERRAQRDVPFTKLWQAAEKHHGDLIRLRLHLKRVLKWDDKDVAANSAGVKTVYELWGVTDESQANLYCVVCSELPPGIPVGTDVQAEAVFVGYFLKVMRYQPGMNKDRGAPLLIGRVRAIAGSPHAAARHAGNLTTMLAVGAAILFISVTFGSLLWRLTRRRRPAFAATTQAVRPAAEVEQWLENFPADEAGSDSHQGERPGS